MTIYALQDSDWAWTYEDGEDRALLVEASSEQEAALKAMQLLSKNPKSAPDGCHFKVAELVFTGFIGVEKDDQGELVVDDDFSKLDKECRL